MGIKIINFFTILLLITAIISIYKNDGNHFYILIIASLNNLTSIALKIKDKING